MLDYITSGGVLIGISLMLGYVFAYRYGYLGQIGTLLNLYKVGVVGTQFRRETIVQYSSIAFGLGATVLTYPIAMQSATQRQSVLVAICVVTTVFLFKRVVFMTGLFLIESTRRGFKEALSQL